MRSMTLFGALCVLGCSPIVSAQAPIVTPRPPTSQPNRVAVEMLKAEAKNVRLTVKSTWVKDFLDGTSRLPPVSDRQLFRDEEKNVFFNFTQFGTLGPGYRATLMPTVFTPIFYYYTKYGSPLAYARPLDVLAQHGVDGLKDKKILDFGYGSVGHLRLMAGLGAQVVGVDVDMLLDAYYSEPIDQGAVEGENGLVGSVVLLHGRFPAEERMRKEVGTGYDLILSKNTLKMGYIHPIRDTDERYLVKLGVTDREFLEACHGILKPGGCLFVYNLHPALTPPDQPFKPWTDGRFPFPRKIVEEVGFKVIEFEKDDSKAAREMGHYLGWDAGDEPMDLQKDLFANYTLLKKVK